MHRIYTDENLRRKWKEQGYGILKTGQSLGEGANRIRVVNK